MRARNAIEAAALIGVATHVFAQPVATQAPTDAARGVLSYAQMIARPLDSVVLVEAFVKEPEQPSEGRADLERFFDYPRGSSETRGSGFVVDAAAGLIVVASYVVKDAASVRITLADGRAFDGTLVGADDESQIALVKIEAGGLTAAEWAESDDLRVGDVVFSAGYPYRLGQAVTAGIVSGFPSSVEQLQYQELIMTDAAIARGNAGGPLLDSRGRVVGVCVGIISSMNDVQLSFAVPAKTARPIVQTLASDGVVVRGSIGVQAEPLEADEDLSDGLQLEPEGILLDHVIAGSGADSAGLEVGDVIVRAAGRTIGSPEELRRIVRATKVGEQIEITYRRRGVEHTVPVTVSAADAQ